LILAFYPGLFIADANHVTRYHSHTILICSGPCPITCLPLRKRTALCSPLELIPVIYILPPLHDIQLIDLTEPLGDDSDADLQFGGPKAREELEKKLLKKLDRRMSILVVIYILNCEYHCILDFSR
jgi:hypothetical protein